MYCSKRESSRITKFGCGWGSRQIPHQQMDRDCRGYRRRLALRRSAQLSGFWIDDRTGWTPKRPRGMATRFAETNSRQSQLIIVIAVESATRNRDVCHRVWSTSLVGVLPLDAFSSHRLRQTAPARPRHLQPAQLGPRRPRSRPRTDGDRDRPSRLRREPTPDR